MQRSEIEKIAQALGGKAEYLSEDGRTGQVRIGNRLIMLNEARILGEDTEADLIASINRDRAARHARERAERNA